MSVTENVPSVIRFELSFQSSFRKTTESLTDPIFNFRSARLYVANELELDGDVANDFQTVLEPIVNQYFIARD